ncbi:Outer membrane protein (porin) [Pasteurella testudinis DSM 23072]|uniref:Outer membrane protein (Porin) n=1 Tax=Pasteurella testudinis DSM 23072 TaxID=1122938 RepID=A0A1W1UNB4_9PAST|nr:porin [Pasteurella testudinis]SMB82204.1 Outer membrane protein (porin) [Pasteurella testudinis DSM 23072]SUB52343.1 major outer membrane protein OmpH-2 [Pasteurella testudinis]
MKKLTLSATLLALAAGSAQAYTAFDNDGTKIELDGSLRLKWTSTSNKTETANGESKEHTNRPVQNNGSRAGFKLTQQLGGDFYAIGRMQFRARGADSYGRSDSQHDFDHLYTHYAFAGFGHKKYGELTYGNQLAYTDYVKQTDLPNTLSISDGYYNTTQRNSLQYVYKGVPGLTLAAFYGFDSDRNANMTQRANRRIDSYGGAAIYKWELANGHKVTLAAGADRERYENANGSNYSRGVYSFGSAYTVSNTTFALDLDQRIIANQQANNAGDIRRTTDHEVRAVVFHRLNKDWNIYTQYGYHTTKRESDTLAHSKVKRDKYMLGTEYVLLHSSADQPFRVKTFLEGQYVRARTYNGSEIKTLESKDKVAVIGLRVYW